MHRSDRYALATLLFLLGLSASMQVLLADSGDKVWLLYAARMWVGGQKLYTGLFEINPPLILWLYGFAVRLSLLVPQLNDAAVLGLMGLLCCALSVALSAWLIRRHPAFAQDRRKRVEFSLLLACIFVFLTPQSFFFDREHILLVMTFPYVLRFTPSLARLPLPLAMRWCVGLSAALGFCIKPHSVILFAAVQLLYVLRERRAAILWSLENRIVMAAALLYLFCMWHFTPQYLTVVLPMALESYSAFVRGGSSMLDLPPALFCFGLTFADFRLRYTSPYRRDIYYFLGIALAFLLHATLSNGWDYTYYPLMSGLLLLSGLVLWECQWLIRENEALGLPSKQFTFGMRGCILSLASQGVYMAIVTILSMNVAAIKRGCDRNNACLTEDPYVRYVQDHHITSFGTITLDYPKWVMLADHSPAQWQTRFNHLWMLPELFQDNAPSAVKHEWILRYVGRALADDLNRNMPAIVFVDSIRPVSPPEFLSQVPQFKEAWSRYRYASTIDECDKGPSYLKGRCRYDIFSRMK